MDKKEEKPKNKFEGKAQKLKEKYLFTKMNGSVEELTANIKHYIKQIKANQAQIVLLERELANKNIQIENLKEKLKTGISEPKNLDKYKDYKQRWTYVEKICYILEHNKKALSAADIVEIIVSKEPILNKRLANPYNSITRSIYAAEKLGRIKRTDKNGGYGFTYCLIT